MILYRASVILAGMALVAATAGTVAAQDHTPYEGNGASAGQPAETAPDMGVDGAEMVVKKKSRKQLPDPEPLPGQKLTLKQVMNIVKSTRNLAGRNLSGLNLVGMDLSKCNLKGIDLKHADLERADLGESNLERADLTGANLKRANLRLSGMTGAKLENANLSGAIWKDGRVCAPASVGQCRESAAPSP
ncbi:MAG TPA: pentapeptide repeat-containing protein [Desulfuromonadaceae bacterium]